MANYSIIFARSARKELEALEPRIVSRVLRLIEALELQPRPVGCRKIRRERSLWRVRAGDYRVVYSVDDSKRVVDIVAIRHRADAYR
jgi:mRNA interferase RelE/StbE